MPETPFKIAVDAMGGDHAPAEVVRGAVQYIRTVERGDVELLLVGSEERLGMELAATDSVDIQDRIRIVPTMSVIAMDEHPMEAFRDKPDSSLVTCTRLVKSGEADATYSAGNTGAVMVAALQILERLEGVKRPAIATFMPNEKGGRSLLVDAGANVDCRASHLLHFGILGSIYAQKVLGIENPRVGLLANGEEQTKGNELTREAHALLAAQGDRLHFVGNVEGNHVFEGVADVVVCDGFVGNVLLKGAEGVVRLVLSVLATDARRAADEAVRDGLLNTLLRIEQRLDYSESGGAPLLGVNGVSFIGHGRSDARAIASGIRQTVLAARTGYVQAMRNALAGVRAEA